MDYKETLDFLFSSLPMYQRIGQAAYKSNLDNTIALDNYLGNPHKKFRSIHVAGTNGKGSVSHMLAAILHRSGYKTGLYTSPHLKDFRERIRINGEMIREDYVVDFIAAHLAFIRTIQPSFFEMTVALAFQYFADEAVDIAVIETGMGGRLDSTNIIRPVVSVITNISHDHTQFLGNTIQEIAEEKAGIIKNQVPVVIGEWQEETEKVFAAKCREKESLLMYASGIYRVDYSLTNASRMQVMNVYQGGEMVYKDLVLDLPGHYQRKNVPAVLLSIDVLRSKGYEIPDDAMYDALSKVKTTTGLRGRWEEIGYDPLIICDTGHNSSGIQEVMEQVSRIPYKNLFIVIGMVNDKDPDTILPLLPSKAQYFFTRADIPRALDPFELKEMAGKYNLKGEAFHTVKDALESARSMANKEDLIFIGGSTFVVAEVLP